MQIQFRSFYDFQFLFFQSFSKFFFKNLIFFIVSILYTAQVKKVKSAENHFLVLFYIAKSISDHFTISELFQVFFQKTSFFHCFEPYTAKVRNMRSEKKSFLVLFYSAKSNSDHFTISNFLSFFKNLIFLLFRPPILHKWEKWRQQKITF